MFGSTNPFGQSSTSPFGSQSIFGQNNAPNNNPFSPIPFGAASPFNAQTGGSLFGGTSTGVFGATQSPSPLATTPSFGVSSTPAFGSSVPAFGATSTPAFGSSSSSFGGSSAFGQKPAFGGFGSTPSQTSPFGGTFQQTQSAFGSGLFGSSTPFGASSQPAFGSTSTSAFGVTGTPPAFGATSAPAFGATSTPAFGATSTPAFGATATPAFGSSTSVFGSTGTTFGAPSAPAFGSGGAFGATSTTPFGASSTPAFGATSTPLFGASSSGFGTSSSPSFNFGSSPSFGQSSSAFGSNTFGTTPSPFGAQTSAFGSQSNTSAFGSPTFGQSAFGAQSKGSRVTSYSPTVETDGGTGTQPAGKLESISAMPTYKEKSHEELRWEDYQLGDKGGPNPAQPAGGIGFGTPTAQPNPFGTSAAQPNPFGTSAAQPNPFGNSTAQPNPFGTSAPQSSPFGTSSTFGQSSPNPFSSSVSANPFASKTSAFSTSPFGASTAFNTSPFGSSSTSPFGTPASTPSIFGGTTSPSLFGTSSSPSLFGSSPSMFNPAPGSTSAFSSNFNTQSAPLFQSSTPSFGLGQNNSGFGQLATPFGQSTPSFSQPNIFGTPSTGFALSTGSTPSFLNTNNQSAFSSPFQTAQMAQTPGGFSFGNFGQTQAPSGFGSTVGSFGQGGTFGQPSASQNTMVMQPTVSNPFGTLPAMPQISIGRSGSSPSVQYGISSMPVMDKPSPVRVSSLLSPRHLSQRRVSLPSRKYHPKKDAPMAPFYFDDEEAPSTPKADALFVPRENPRTLVIHPSEKWSWKASMDKSSSAKNTAEPVPKKSNLTENDSDKDRSDDAKAEERATRVQEDRASEKSVSGQRAGEADIEALMPKLKHADYYTEPSIQELAAKERAEPGFCQHVKDFVIGRKGYGSIRFDGETDVRGLDLESLVQFNDREVVVYMDESKKPPVGHGLNKSAEVALLNIKCVDKKTGQQHTDGRRVEKYKAMLMKKAEEQGAEFVSYEPMNGEWRFKVKHFSRYSL